MDNILEIKTERVDDFVLLLEIMKQMNLPDILDRHLPEHWLQQGLSWGWTATIWLAHIISQGDHRKLTVRDWVKQAHDTLERVTGLSIRDTDFTDDRLTIVLRHLSKEEAWQAIEHDLGQNLVQVYHLGGKIVRVDATTVSGYHAGDEESVMQFGKSKDNPALKQVKVMLGTLDPLGLPLAVDVVSGEKADDPLYIPIIDRLIACLQQAGLLFVGDSKMSALVIRAHLQAEGQYYLMPLALVGETGRHMPDWIQAGVDSASPMTLVYGPDDQTVLAEGYELIRQCVSESNGQILEWDERVLVVQSLAHAEALKKDLHQRLEKAQAELLALTPARGRGKRQIQAEETLVSAAEAILSKYAVLGLLHYHFERQVEQQTKFVKQGRPTADRPTQVVERVRYQITTVTRHEPAITTYELTLGWRAYATNAPPDQLSLPDAVLTYRQEYRVERSFGRLKGAPLSISPVFVKRDDQIVGLTHLLMLAVRLLTLIEFVVRRALHATQTSLVGLHPENPRKATARPTTERLLKAFDNITLTSIQFPDRLVRHLTPLTPLQERILLLLNLSPAVYLSLAWEIPDFVFPLRE